MAKRLIVVIYFQISIFELLKTTVAHMIKRPIPLWFTFKLVSLNYWKQPWSVTLMRRVVVIYFQISIFELLKTTN